MRCCIKSRFPLAGPANGISRRARFIAILLLIAAGCSRSPQLATLDLPIYFTCDTEGRLEPCGCFIGQFGGLTRLKTVLDAKAPAGALRVDVGDAIGGHEDHDFIEYRYVLRAFAAMNYDALNIGHLPHRRWRRLTSCSLARRPIQIIWRC